MGNKISSQTAKRVAKIADGQVIIYHSLLVINLKAVVKISFSGDGFKDASIWFINKRGT
jgi:hypothetical protein